MPGFTLRKNVKDSYMKRAFSYFEWREKTFSVTCTVRDQFQESSEQMKEDNKI